MTRTGNSQASMAKKAVSALKPGKGLEHTRSGKISVREAKQITRRIIERIRKEE